MKMMVIGLLTLAMISLVVAGCTENNDFVYGDDIYLCSGDCNYENGSVCDSKVNATISVYYPNGTKVIINHHMIRTGDHFEYNLSKNLSVSSTGQYGMKGNYSAMLRVKGERVGEWTDPIDFSFSILETKKELDKTGGNQYLSTEGIDKKISDLEKELGDIIKKYWFWIGILGVVVLILGLKIHKIKARKMAKATYDRLKASGLNLKRR